MRCYDLTDPESRVVGKVLREQATHIGDTVWLHSDDRKVRFAEAEALVNRYARGLIAAGVEKGESVAMFVEPSIDSVLLAVAVTRTGALFTTINTDFHTGFLEEALTQADAKLLIIDAPFLSRLDKLPTLAGIKSVFTIGSAPAIQAIPHADTAEWLSLSSDPVEEQASWQDPLQCWWSSGTTGKPKGILHSHSSVLVQCTAYNREYLDDEVLYACTPLYLGSAWSGSLWTSLVYGVTAAIDARFSVSRFWDRIRHYKATQAFTLGAMHILLWKAAPTPGDTDHALRRFVAIPMPTDLIPKFKKRFNIGAMSQGYGTSETFRVFDSPDENTDKTGALIGTPVPRYEISLRDSNDLPVPVGTAGEICVRPREPGHLYLGYFNDPQRTLDAWTNLWHHTGDMALQKEDGLYYFADRKKDYIRYKGRSLSMFEIEQVVDGHPEIVDVAAYGIQSAELESESELMIAVVRKPDSSIDAEQLARFINDQAPYFYVPRYVRFVDELPRNAHGRIQKNDLRDGGVTADTWDRESTAFVITRD
jgi:crotonobetaine/carnitine-CoA ligase